MSTRGSSRGRGRARGGSDAGSTSSRGTGPPATRAGPGRGRGRAVSPSPSTTTQSYPRGRGGAGPGGYGGPRGRGGPPSGPIIYQESVRAQLPSQLEPAALRRLVDSFKSIKASPDRPLRPGYGTVGTAVNLRTNFFAVKIRKAPIFDYVVTITPTTDLRRLRTRIFQLLEQSPTLQPHLSYIAHDNSQRLVAAKKLPQPLEVPIQFYEDNEKGPGPKAKVYMVSITLERELAITELDKHMEGQVNYRDYDPLPLTSAMNLILQQHAGRAGVRYGKNRYFFPNLGTRQLGRSIEAVQGFYSSVRPGLNQLLVNVNVCMTAFVKPGNLADKLLEFRQSSSGAMPTLPKSLVRSIHVRTMHLGYKKKLFAIGASSARNQKFDCAEFGGTISVEQYFLKKYNKKLQHSTDLPVVNIGNRDRPNWMPAELCQIENGNIYRDKLSDNETSEMIRYACNPPRINAESIVDKGFPSLGFSNPPKSPLAGFGVTIDKDLLVVPGRELDAPKLSYKAGQARVQNGGWNIVNIKFQRGATVSGWWVLVVQDGRSRIKGPNDTGFKGLVEGFRMKMASTGMAVPPGPPTLLQPATLLNPNMDPNRKQSLDVIRNIFNSELQKKGRKPSFVLVLLENRDHYIYPGIKRIGDMELGIQTVHMQVDKAMVDDRKQDQYLSNVALKVNTKLGGVNHVLEDQSMRWLSKQRTMMVGIDVTHPGMGTQEGTPSIAAVVASVDDKFVQFPASLRIQKAHQMKEMLDELDEMLVERLNFWGQNNRAQLPDRILVYRDGVSEGQFNQVIEQELPQILKAFKKLSHVGGRKEYRPKLSIIICGKRHHAKFWPENSQHADKNGNTRPGTVVDAGITGVFDYDFYLQAHAGLQGHVKATHYTIIYDENNLAANEIQQGTHDSSYLYARATRAVSLIPAAYYADLACERGRCYLNDFLMDSGSTVGGRGGDRDDERNKVYEAAKNHWGEGLHPDIRGSMFYI